MVCWREFTNNSYTLESSFGESTDPKPSNLDPHTRALHNAQKFREYRSQTLNPKPFFSGGGDKEHEPANGHLAIADYEKMGADVCRAICQVLCVDEESLSEIEARLLEKVTNPKP